MCSLDIQARSVHLNVPLVHLNVPLVHLNVPLVHFNVPLVLRAEPLEPCVIINALGLARGLQHVLPRTQGSHEPKAATSQRQSRPAGPEHLIAPHRMCCPTECVLLLATNHRPQRHHGPWDQTYQYTSLPADMPWRPNKKHRRQTAQS